MSSPMSARTRCLLNSAELQSLETYLKHHNVQGTLNKAVNKLLEEKPSDPFSLMVSAIRLRDNSFARVYIGLRQARGGLCCWGGWG